MFSGIGSGAGMSVGDEDFVLDGMVNGILGVTV